LALFGAVIEEIRFACDSPLEEAVMSELVSEAKFPASWENTGNLLRGAPQRAGRIGNPQVITAA
jgi:hypothetical protein